MPHKKLLFDFIVPGRAVSFQSKNKNKKAAWKDAVKRCAREEWEKRGLILPLAGRLRLVVTHFTTEGFLADARPDDDNILWTVMEVVQEPDAIKGGRDALQGVVCTDDAQIEETQVRIRGLDGEYRIRGASPLLIEGLVQGKEFTYFKITTPSDPKELDTFNHEYS